MTYVPSNKQLVDLLTKPLSESQHQFLSPRLTVELATDSILRRVEGFASTYKQRFYSTYINLSNFCIVLLFVT